MFRLLVGGEARAFGRELEQHATRLEEVDGLEPKSVDHFRRPTTRLGDPVANLELHALVGNAPGNVMHGAHAPRAAWCVRCLAHLDVLAGAASVHAETMPAVLLAVGAELEHLGEKRRREREIVFPHADAVESAYLSISGNGTPWPWLELAFICRLDEREMLSMRIGEREHALSSTNLFVTELGAVFGETLAPVLEAAFGNRQRDFDPEPGTDPA